jgi:hypothetical protein
MIKMMLGGGSSVGCWSVSSFVKAKRLVRINAENNPPITKCGSHFSIRRVVRRGQRSCFIGSDMGGLLICGLMPLAFEKQDLPSRESFRPFQRRSFVERRSFQHLLHPRLSRSATSPATSTRKSGWPFGQVGDRYSVALRFRQPIPRSRGQSQVLPLVGAESLNLRTHGREV